MRNGKARVISVRATEADYLAISAMASRQKLTLSKFMLFASLERAEVRPFFSDEDLFILRYLREELRNDGLLFMDHIRALNWGDVSLEDTVKADVQRMSRTVAALCIELKACVNPRRGQLSEANDATG
jgi:hypothetical protein